MILSNDIDNKNNRDNKHMINDNKACQDDNDTSRGHNDNYDFNHVRKRVVLRRSCQCDVVRARYWGKLCAFYVIRGIGSTQGIFKS